jgi:hypothetical protein
MRKIILAAAFAALAVPAFADTPWTATPVQPSSRTGFVGDTVIWNCGASGCWSGSDTSDADQRDLQRRPPGALQLRGLQALTNGQADQKASPRTR